MNAIDKNREYFSLDLLTGKNAPSRARMPSLVIQEFLALTLMSNRDLAKVLLTYGKALGFSEVLPKSIYDEWLSRRAQGKQASADVATTAERKRLRKQVLALRGESYHQIDEQLGLKPGHVEHITFRALLVQVEKVQSRDHGRMQVLLVAYHLEQCWLHVMLTDPCQGYAAQSGKQAVLLSAMLTTGQWTDFAEKLRARQMATGGNADTPIILHAPKGSGLDAVLSQAGLLLVVEDMPASRTNAPVLRIKFKFKHSVSRPLAQVSLADLLLPPVVDDPLLNADMSALPDLTKLNHHQKDTLINTLWSSLTSLRQQVTQSGHGEGLGDNLDKSE